MIDAPLRRLLEVPLDWAARALDVRWVTPDGLTLTGLAVGVLSGAAAAFQFWPLALVLWLFSRFFDGIDGALARLRRSGALEASGAGGFLDIIADFVSYGSSVIGVAIGAAVGFGAPWWPFLAVLFAYYVNGAAFLAFSSIAERTGRQVDDGRSLSFIGHIAEAAETIVVHSLWLILPGWSWQLAAAWAVFVAVSAVLRIIQGYRLLR